MSMESTKCLKCGGDMYSLTKEQDYWVCVDCGSVFTCEADTPREARKQVIKAMKENGEQYIHIKAKKGGSKSAKNHTDNKARLQRPSTTNLYNVLANKENNKSYKIL